MGTLLYEQSLETVNFFQQYGTSRNFPAHFIGKIQWSYHGRHCKMTLLITLLMSPIKNGWIKNYMIHCGANISLECRTVSPSVGLSIVPSIHLSIYPSIRPSVQNCQIMAKMYGQHKHLSKAHKVKPALTDLRILAILTTVKPRNNGFEGTKYSSLLQKSIIANTESKKMSRD